ncbi:MAG: hypothetical protein KGZ90_10910 [Algoriphagus sp.]|jgi:hypothetical protein|nr:hypothetical protein [Algoriphagus sp.]
MSQQASVLRRIVSADGKRYAELSARGIFFAFEEYTEEHDSGYAFMVPTHCSGLYATQAEAERDMMAELPWLRDGNVA